MLIAQRKQTITNGKTGGGGLSFSSLALVSNNALKFLSTFLRFFSMTTLSFLLRLSAMSVGLGNLWRFPFVAWSNGGGAFVIPYLIVLFVIGKPGYFMEMAMGQFSSRGTIKVYDCVPACRGVGSGQVLSSMFVATYYSSIMGLTLKYLYDSFSVVLPWSICRTEWGSCSSTFMNDSLYTSSNTSNKQSSSAELYFA